MKATLLLALLAAQPEPRSDAVTGVVLRDGGLRAEGAVVRLVCDAWSQTVTVGADGSFAIPDVPDGACTLEVRAADDPSAGVVMALPANRSQPLPVMLPRGVRHVASSGATGLRLDISSSAVSKAGAPRWGRFEVTGTGSSSSGASPWNPVARPDQWSTGSRRPGKVRGAHCSLERSPADASLAPARS